MSALKLSTMSSCVSQDLGVAIGFARQCALDGLGLDRVWLQPIEALAETDSVGSLLRVIARERIDVLCLATGLFRCRLDCDAALQADLARLESTLRLAEVLKAPVVRCYGFLRGVTPEGHWPRLLEHMQTASELAARHEVTLGIQNDPQTFLGTGQELATLIEAVGSEHLRAVWDPCAALFVIDDPEIPYPDGYRRLQTHITQVVLRDVDRHKHRGALCEVELGEGLLDLRGQIRALLADGFSGVVSLATSWRPGMAWDRDPDQADHTEAGGQQAIRICAGNVRQMVTGSSRTLAHQEDARLSREVVLAPGSAAGATVWFRPDAQAVEQYAARQLEHYLAEMLGKPVVFRSRAGLAAVPSLYLALDGDEPDSSAPTCVHELAPDGYRLRGHTGGVLLQSSSPRGLLFAVYGLLRHLGARWFFPGPDGEVVPRLRGLDLSGLDVVSQPAIAQRGFLLRGTDRYLQQWVDFAPRVGLNAIALETHEGIHRLPDLARGRGLDLWLRRHFFPAAFCSQDERRLHWEEILMKGYLQSLPAELDSAQVRPADAFGARCTCGVDATYSLADQVMRFTNRMARAAREVRPDQEYPYVAYQSTWCPPPQVEADPGVNLSLATMHRCHNHAIDDPDCWINATYRYREPMGRFEYGLRPIIEEHLKRFDPETAFLVGYWVDASLFGRDYMRHWQRRLPNNGAVMQRDIRYYHSLGIPSIWTFVVFVDDEYLARFTSPLIFQYGALLWDPETDLRAGLRDFCRLYLGDEALHEAFPLHELSDPRDASREEWLAQGARVSKALAMVREAAASAGSQLCCQRLAKLAAEHEHCLRVIHEHAERGQPPQT